MNRENSMKAVEGAIALTEFVDSQFQILKEANDVIMRNTEEFHNTQYHKNSVLPPSKSCEAEFNLIFLYLFRQRITKEVKKSGSGGFLA